VDTKVYAQVLDVFVDSFPFPCAFTLYESMAAGKPVLTYASPESAETGLHGLLWPLLNGESGSPEEQDRARGIFGSSLYLCARTPEAYAEMATRLAHDAELRHATGEANRMFVAEFLSDRRRSAQIVATHLRELLDAAQATS
jgi:glycosyltransferase involved in cell wall biosynthesis